MSREPINPASGQPAEKKRRKSIREISPIDVYKLLPKINCRECRESNCMAFSTRLVNGEVVLLDCPPILTEEYREAHTQLIELLAPPVRAVTFGSGPDAVTIGGKYVLQRHEFTYHNPSPIAIDLHDLMPEQELLDRVKTIGEFSYNYIGRTLSLNAIAIRCSSRDAETFRDAVKRVVAASKLPLILCAHDPHVMEAGLSACREQTPLIYAATETNWKQMAELALQYRCPLVVSAPVDMDLLRSLTKTLFEYGVEDLVLDPGTIGEEGLAVTIANFTGLRTEACRHFDELSGFPLLGIPMTVWTGSEISEDVLKWKEAITASMLLSRYADLLIMHSMDGWVLLPQMIWRFNIYTDPRKPVSVEPGLRAFGKPDRNSPVLVTTNYALTFFTIESDIKAANLDCYLLIVDTGGLSVESAVAGRYFNADSIANGLAEYNVESLVGHKTLIIPGLAARLSGDAEEASGWKILVGPKDSSGLAQFIRKRWSPGS
ncbi:MAG: Acetyl-CoA decarbonylase/synthase complex subunit gamma [Methanoregula sp. SKADARSKE-2]|nr:MAG: Acetyl-CoA decarbonylase/synthase complex subunit gamma [Methanoregula sp. SKADARSKE-2]